MKRGGDVQSSNTSSSANLLVSFRKAQRLWLYGLLVVVILATAVTIFAVVYIKSTKRSNTEGKEIIEPSTPETLKGKLDMSTNPCDDFYQFSCGGYISKTQIPKDSPNLDSFTSTQEKVFQILKKLLENKNLTSNYSKNATSSIQKAVNYYQSCMNEADIERTGTEPILKIANAIAEDLNQLNDISEKKGALERVLAYVERDLGTSAFITFGITPNVFDTSKVVISISGESATQKFLRETLTDAEQEERLKKYKNLMKKIFHLLGITISVDSLVELERGFLKARKSGFEEERYDELSDKFKLMTVEDLNRLNTHYFSFVPPFDWSIYFEEIIMNTGYTIKPGQEFMVEDPDVLKEVVTFITSQSKRTLGHRIIFLIVLRFITSLPQSFQEALNDFTTFTEGIQARPRWKTCVMETDAEFEYATALLYKDKHFSKETRDRAVELFKEIKEQFIGSLKDQDWMDGETRNAARLKLVDMKERIGYPDFIDNPSELDKVYEQEEVKPYGYFQNKLNIFQARFQKKVNTVGKSPDNKRYSLSPNEVNAFYSPTANTMTVLMAILQEPFYEKDRIKALNYGGIGVTIGHEITHGFDATGRHFDEHGNLRSWWTYSSKEDFIERSKCFVDQYNKQIIFGRLANNGLRTLSENIADNGGLKFAYKAYQKWKSSAKTEEKIPGLSYNNEQLFFISFAQLFCSKYREKDIDRLLKESHSLDPLRVRVTVSNFPAFNKAFGCRQPLDTCTLW